MRKPFGNSYGHYIPVVPHAATNHADGEAQALFVGSAGAVAAVRPDGTAVIFPAVPAGTTIEIRTIRVNAVGTDADDMVALYFAKGYK